MSDQEHKPGDLRVWWIPQIPGKSFEVSVGSIAQGAFLLKTLALYDIFQLENKIKPDFCNVGGLSVWCEDADGDGTPGWCDWIDEETGEDDPFEWVKRQAA